MAPRHAVDGHHHLQRHAERLGVVRRLPGVGPVVLEQAAGLAGERARAHRVARRRLEVRLHLLGRHVGLLDGQPQRTGPHPGCAHDHGGGHLAPRAHPARGQHRQRCHRVDHLGPQHDRAHVAGVAPALGALADDDVDAGRLVVQGVLDRAGQRGHEHPVVVHLGDHVVGGRAERVGHQLDLGVAQDDLDEGRRRGRRPAEQLAPGAALDLGHAVVGQDLLGEGAVLLGDHRPQLGLELDRVDLVHALVLAGDDDVDAVRVVTHVLVEPGQLHLELVRAEADGAQDAHATGVRHGGRHVAAVGEGEDGELDPEAFAELVVHGGDLRIRYRAARSGNENRFYFLWATLPMSSRRPHHRRRGSRRNPAPGRTRPGSSREARSTRDQMRRTRSRRTSLQEVP